MQIEPTPEASARRLTDRQSWIGPVWGFVASMLALLIGRTTGFEYSREASGATFFAVFVLVSSYHNGKLKTEPATTVAWVAGAGVGSVLITRFVQWLP